ncbi:hypothetical protein [Nonomuraea dietziae]|uniref:hypothetical protein n=1 Tax=Nonomuraea dietziae TaxID=65515 RepID=UPI0033EB0D79
MPIEPLEAGSEEGDRGEPGRPVLDGLGGVEDEVLRDAREAAVDVVAIRMYALA